MADRIPKSTGPASNLDARSLEFNDELNVVVFSDEFARDVATRLFNRDIRQSDRIRAHRPTLRERMGRVLSFLL